LSSWPSNSGSSFRMDRWFRGTLFSKVKFLSVMSPPLVLKL
jgi:hypothetical protein